MPKTQKSKRARDTKKGAEFAGLRYSTGHPSHCSAGDVRAKGVYWERKYG